MNERLKRIVAQITVYQYELEQELEATATHHTAKVVDAELPIHTYMTAKQQKVFYNSIGEKYKPTLESLVPKDVVVNLEVSDADASGEGKVNLKAKKVVDETSIRDIAKAQAIANVTAEFNA